MLLNRRLKVSFEIDRQVLKGICVLLALCVTLPSVAHATTRTLHISSGQSFVSLSGSTYGPRLQPQVGSMFFTALSGDIVLNETGDVFHPVIQFDSKSRLVLGGQLEIFPYLPYPTNANFAAVLDRDTPSPSYAELRNVVASLTSGPMAVDAFAGLNNFSPTGTFTFPQGTLDTLSSLGQFSFPILPANLNPGQSGFYFEIGDYARLEMPFSFNSNITFAGSTLFFTGSLVAETGFVPEPASISLATLAAILTSTFVLWRRRSS